MASRRTSRRAVLAGLVGVACLSQVAAGAGRAPQDRDGEGVSIPSFPDFLCEPEMPYCNRAVEAGLHTVQRYGRGAAFVDIDGDGWDDLFLADCDNRWDFPTYGVSMFFLNNRDGTFAPHPATELGIADRDLVATWSGSFADYDNDGDPDLLLVSGGYSALATLALYENRFDEGEGFVSVTAESGIGVVNAERSRWWGASWADYDGDGLLDVAVTRLAGRAVLFHNEGRGEFREVSGPFELGIEVSEGKNPVWLDYDDDGDPDLYLAGMDRHAFYRNDRDGAPGNRSPRFTDVTDELFAGLFATLPYVFTTATDDFNQDGIVDLYLGRWNLQDGLLLSDGVGGFEVHATDWGLETSFGDTSDLDLVFENSMGLGVGDFFDDGYPDVFIGTGSPPRAAADIIFCNTIDESFYRCTDQILQGVSEAWRTRGHGTAFGDFDQDFDTDVVINLGGQPGFDAGEGSRISTEWPALLVSQAEGSGNRAAILLEGTVSNRDAIGARIRVEGDAVHYYRVRSTEGFGQNSRWHVVDLGDGGSADVEVLWPTGLSERLTVRAGDRMRIVEEGVRGGAEED